MSSLAERIDRFVRWFFNVSPHLDAIEPVPPDPRLEAFRRRRALAATARAEARLEARERRRASVRHLGRST